MENKYHRYLNLPFDVKVPEYCKKVPESIAEEHLGYFDRNILDFHRSLGLDIEKYNLLYTKPHSNLMIHSDTSYVSDFVKINITWGSNESYTCWWKSKKSYLKTDPTSGFKLLQANKEDCVMIWRAKITKPSIVNSGQLHSTWNPTNQGRWTLSFVPIDYYTRECIDWYSALKLYRDFIEEF